MRPHPSTCATIPQWPGCRSALRPNLSSTSGGPPSRTVWARAGLKPAPAAVLCRPSRRPGFHYSVVDIPCRKERLPLTRRYFWAPVPMRVGGGAWLLCIVHALRDIKRGIGGILGMGVV